MSRGLCRGAVLLAVLHVMAVDAQFSIGLPGYLWTSGDDRTRLGQGSNELAKKMESVYQFENHGKHLRSVSMSSTHAIAVTQDGLAWSWGESDYGQLGHPDDLASSVPRPIEFFNDNSAPIRLTHLSTGLAYSMVITEDGVVYVWGNNVLGQLGLGDRDDRSTPTELVAMKGAISLACSEAQFSLGVKEDNTVWSWGSGENQLGHGGTPDQSDVPVEITALNGLGIVSVHAQKRYAIAISNTGALYTWGSEDGALGRTVAGPSPTPAAVAGTYIDGYTTVGLGTTFAIGLRDDPRQVLTWGTGLGLGQPDVDEPTPLAFFDGKPAVWVDAAAKHSLAVTEDGKVYSWGKEGAYLGRLAADTSEPDEATVNSVPAGRKLTRVTAATSMSAAYESKDTFVKPSMPLLTVVMLIATASFVVLCFILVAASRISAAVCPRKAHLVRKPSSVHSTTRSDGGRSAGARSAGGRSAGLANASNGSRRGRSPRAAPRLMG